MRKVHFFGVLVALVMIGVMVGSAQAADRWFVVQNYNGQTSVTNEKPGPDWVVTFGPYATEDEAIRAAGTGHGLGFTQFQSIPSKDFDREPARPEFRGMYFFREAG